MRRANRALSERVAELERQLKRFAGDSATATLLGGSLSEREALMSEAERIVHMGSWVWNVATNEVRWSDELYRILGCDPVTEPASFERFFARIHPEDLKHVQEASARSTASGVNERVEFRAVRPDGVIRHLMLDAALLFDGRGQLQRAVGAALDVTEQREVERELKRTAALLAEAQRIGKMGSFELDMMPPRQAWSEELYRILELDPSTPPSLELFVQRLHEDDRERIQFLIERSLDTGLTEPSRARIVASDGRIRHVTMMAVPTRDHNGDLIAIRGTVSDVTALVELEAQFHQSQKMDAVGQLAGGLAHDYNNLLTVISGNAELLLDRQESREAREILEAATAATSLTNRLLTFTRQNAQRARVGRIADDLELAKNLILRALGDRIVLHIELAQDLWPVYVDSGQIQQVLLNLALNARDAMPEGGSFSIAARNATLDPDEARHRSVSSGDYVAVAVTDTGSGMTEDTQRRAFEPFFTTKPIGHGTGLGLAMVFGCMQSCGGFVELHSKLGTGTTFSLWFPRSRLEQTEPVAPVQAAQRSLASALLVEDNTAVAHVATMILKSAGYEVRVAHEPNQAIALWHARPADVLITDVDMPGMSGVKLSEQLKRHTPGIRTLFITGQSGEQLEAAQTEHSAILTKPFRRQELLLA
ncbi:MAG TPA: response regulator, partial [Polyangiales bacterium]|nr:response regulator [Polyangiales bacterium]